MTLIEVLIVLALLAGLASVTLSGVGEMNHRTRFDESTRRLREIEMAVQGNGVEGGRFLHDMGRLPMVQELGGGRMLSELWTPAPGTAYARATLPEGAAWPDGDVTIPLADPRSVELLCGWNGPYLHVGHPGEATLWDGFGNEWRINGKDRGAISIGETITTVQGLGSNGTEGGSLWHEVDQTLDLATHTVEAILHVTLKARDASSDPAVWRPLRGGKPDYHNRVWSAGQNVAAGSYTVSTDLRHLFQCTEGGLTGGTEPDWQRGASGAITEDGVARWRYEGRVPGHRVDVVRVRVFVPDVDATTLQLRWVAYNGEGDGIHGFIDGDAWNGSLVPGVRKVYAYAFRSGWSHLDGTPVPPGAYVLSLGSQAMGMELKPGTNHLTLHLD